MADSEDRVRRLAEAAGISPAAGRSYDWEAIEAALGIPSRPVFGPDPPSPEPGPPGDILQEFRHPLASSEMPVLRAIIGAPPAGAPAVDWDAVHARLGLVLPSDYREFIDAYGPGTFGVIRITVPGGPGEWDLFALLERRQAQVKGVPRVSPTDIPFHPDAGGVVSWGVTGDGRTLAWAPMGPDPDKWTVVLIRANTRPSLERLNGWTSFSAVLRFYAEHYEPRDLLSMAYPEDVEVRFAPFRY